MAHPFDPSAIGHDIVSKVGTILGSDLTIYVSFAQQQAKLLAKQAAWIAEATISKEITAKERDYFLKDLKELSLNFVRTIVALTALTIEKIWNAIVGTLWGAMNSALDAAGIPISIPTPVPPKS